MRHKGERRDSKSFVVVDEDCGIPTSIVEDYRGLNGIGPLAQADPRTLLLSMSGYDKAHGYDVYEYVPATRPEQAHDYTTFPAPPTYPAEYVSAHAQVPSGLPQTTAAFPPVPPAQQYEPHDPTYYAQQNVQYPAYVEPTPRPLPDVLSYTPNRGQPGTKVTVYIRSVYDLDPPTIKAAVMFGQNRRSGVVMKTSHTQPFQYALTVDAPPLSPSTTPSPQVPLSLTFGDSPVVWDPATLEFGSFTYIDSPVLYQLGSPQITQKKRKLSPHSSPRRSPTKKQSLQQLAGSTSVAQLSSPFRRPSIPDPLPQPRRFSGPELQHYSNRLPRVSGPQYYAQSTPLLQTAPSPSWNYPQTVQGASRSPSGPSPSTGARLSIPTSSAGGSNPPLVRTSTLQQSPVTASPVNVAIPPTFNPYAIYPSNAKAMLKIDGDLNTMGEKWTTAEWEAQRRLVQFRRSQTGSVITATFEPVTLEDRVPNSICVSCIWWEEKKECYVTSVDTISLLESLVAVRFTVEEKNRIRRNLEGFRPATVSKAKQDSEEFFKLIMGFPNPKPRNIEKDVKVFPWRILSTALKKIIGKYASPPTPPLSYRLSHFRNAPQANNVLQSASYSSTAAALHNPTAAGPTYTAARASEVGIEQQAHQRLVVSPHSTSSSATSHGHAYAPTMAGAAYPPHAVGPAGLPVGPSAVPAPGDLRLVMPTPSAANQTTSWHQPSAHYSSDISATGRGSWDYGATGYMTASPATGVPVLAAPSYAAYPQQRMPSISSGQLLPTDARFMPLRDYGQASHPTTNA